MLHVHAHATGIDWSPTMFHPGHAHLLSVPALSGFCRSFAMPTTKPCRQRVQLLKAGSEMVWTIFDKTSLSWQEFYSDYLHEFKRERFLSLAKEAKVSVHKVEKALSHCKVLPAQCVPSLLCPKLFFCSQAPPLEFHFLDVHEKKGLCEEMVFLAFCNISSCLRVNPQTSTLPDGDNQQLCFCRRVPVELCSGSSYSSGD